MVRFKNRYLLAHVEFADAAIDDSLSQRDLFFALKSSISYNFGLFGEGLLGNGLQVKYCNGVTGQMIVRCARDSHRLVWFALTSITKLRSREATVSVLHVGGSLRTCQQAAIKYNKALIARLLRDDREASKAVGGEGESVVAAASTAAAAAGAATVSERTKKMVAASERSLDELLALK